MTAVASARRSAAWASLLALRESCATALGRSACAAGTGFAAGLGGVAGTRVFAGLALGRDRAAAFGFDDCFIAGALSAGFLVMVGLFAFFMLPSVSVSPVRSR